MFSILIPTWNNLEMLKLCIEAIKQNSAYEHEIILHINEGSDGTQKWADTEGVLYAFSPENIGICKAMNWAYGKATKDYIVYLNDDMYVLPDWDKFLIEEIQSIGNQLFMLSSTLIEPTPHRFPCMIYGDYGRDVLDFKKAELLADFNNFEMNDWSGSSWPPLVVSREAWLTIGGFSIEFSPGMYSDPDFSMKMWHAGCRIFKGLGKSRVYHFQSRSTGRVKKNNGRLQFMKKWGLPSSIFYSHYLRMGEPYEGILTEPTEGVSLKLQRLKAGFYSFFK
jgi:glycosyltransferase involved in cell wall biosynthesis